jgi:hypothetical protein
MGRHLKAKVAKTTSLTEKKFNPLVYGLKGIMDLFHVSKPTASRYKNTILKDACEQQGQIIVTDVRKALRAFGFKDVESFVSKESASNTELLEP